MKNWAKPGGFLRGVVVLVSGTAFAHAITALSLPVLTRMYSPADFSLLAIFSGILAVISVAGCLRFEVAIPLAEQAEKAFNLLILSLASLLALVAALTAIVWFAPNWTAAQFGRPDLQPYLILLPWGFLFAGTYSALQNWFVREKAFGLIAKSRVAQSAVSAGTQVGMGGFGVIPSGLIIGYMLNSGVACLTLGYRLISQGAVSTHVPKLTLKSLQKTWGEFSRFPKYSTWEALANSAAIQVPMLIIAAVIVGPEAGYLLLAMTVIQAPMALFGNAIAQVYLSRAPAEFREGRLGSFTTDILGALIKIGVGPLLAVGIISPLLFGMIFGLNWERAGWLVTWMTPWFILQFLATPISMAMHITGHQRAAFFLQIGGLLFRTTAVWVAVTYYRGSESVIYALSGAVFYAIYLWVILASIRCNLKSVLFNTRKSLIVVFVWGLATAFIVLLTWLLGIELK